MWPCRSLEQLLVSLQWGRQQSYYPSAQALSTGELAVANHKLADAVNSHLLGNVGSSSLKSDQASELCNTPAEKMAEKVSSTELCLSSSLWNDDDNNNGLHLNH